MKCLLCEGKYTKHKIIMNEFTHAKNDCPLVAFNIISEKQIEALNAAIKYAEDRSTTPK